MTGTPPSSGGGVIVTVSGTVTGGTGVTEPLDEELEIVEDDGIGTATDMTRPVMLMGSGAVEGDRVTLVFTEALKSDRTPRPILFHVIIDGNLIVRPRTVEVIGYRVFLTLREPVEPASVVSVGYNPPKHNNLDIDLTRALQDLAGIPVYATRQTSLDNDTKPRVELVLTPSSIDENGGVSVVTATVPEASMTPFTVEVAVTPVAPATADDVTVSSNTVLSFRGERDGKHRSSDDHRGRQWSGRGRPEVTVSGTLGAGASDVSGPMDLTLTILDDEAPSRPAQPTQPAGTASIQKTLAGALRAHDGPVCAGWGAAAADRPARGRAARQARRPGLQRHRAAAGPAAQCARRCGGLEPVPVAPRHGARPADRDRLSRSPARPAAGPSPCGARADTGMRPRVARLGAEFAYGFPAFAGRFTGTPYLGLGLTQGGGDARIGWRLAAARRDDVDMTFGLEAARREDAGGDPEHTAGLRLTTRW